MDYKDIIVSILIILAIGIIAFSVYEDRNWTTEDFCPEFRPYEGNIPYECESGNVVECVESEDTKGNGWIRDCDCEGNAVQVYCPVKIKSSIWGGLNE